MFLHHYIRLFADVESLEIKLTSNPPHEDLEPDDDPFGLMGPDITMDIDHEIGGHNSHSTTLTFSINEAEDLVRRLSNLITNARLGIYTEKPTPD